MTVSYAAITYIAMEESMKMVWSKPVVAVTSVGMEVTSYAPAELEDEIVI